MEKTITIYLQETGSTLLVDIPCRLYKGSYKDKNIEIYVPTSWLYEANTFVNAVSIHANLIAENGTNSTTISYYPDYIDEVEQDGVTYAVYSLPMPNTFTAYEGTQEVVVQVVNVDNTDPLDPVVLEIKTTQQTNYVVNPSSANVEEIDASAATQLAGQVQALQAEVLLKQDITDGTLHTTNKTVPTAINEINTQVGTNTSDISTQSGLITGLRTDVNDLLARAAGAEIPVGSMSGTTKPTAAQLNAYTVSQMGDNPEPNYVIIFTLQIAGATDEVYKYVYVRDDFVNSDGLVGWTYYDIPALEHASNGTYGSIQGTYAIDSTNNILVNIADGEIVDIYYKDSDGVYQNIRSSINLIKDTQDGIIDGTQVVALATKAVQDQLGNVINTTYAQASTVYTKTETDAKYLAKTYTNVYYYATSGLVDDVPNTPASGIQFTETVDTIGETLLCDCGRTTVGDYHFSKNSSDNSSIVLATDVDCSLQFRLETYANDTILSADLSDVMTFTANTPQTLDITSIYSQLGTTEIDVPAGSTISKKLYIISTDITEKNVYLYSNATYPSTYQLNAQSIVLTLNTINGLKPVYISDDEWTDNGDDTYTVVIPQTRHQQPASTRYFLELQKQITANSYQYIAFTPIVADSGDITITTNEAIDCVLLIGSNLSTDERGILTLTNPTVAQEIDYNLYGAMKVTQTTQPVALNLLAPTDAGKFYAFFITNDENSTETINWNGEDITAGSGLQFRWDGAEWIVGEQPTSTTEIYDTNKDQLLSTTLSQLDNSVNANSNSITTLNNTKADASALSGYVPTTRTVNNKALSDNITLTASDVGAISNTTTINGQSISNNVTLTASDVGAYTTTQTDTLISNVTLPKLVGEYSVTSTTSHATDSDHKSVSLGETLNLELSLYMPNFQMSDIEDGRLYLVEVIKGSSVVAHFTGVLYSAGTNQLLIGGAYSPPLQLGAEGTSTLCAGILYNNYLEFGANFNPLLGLGDVTVRIKKY